MAATLDGARSMAAAAKKSGVTLAVNWPIVWSPAFRMLKKLVEDKAIGDLWELKWRNPASLGPLAHGSLHPGDTVISGAVSDAEKGSEWWHQAGAGGGLEVRGEADAGVDGGHDRPQQGDGDERDQQAGAEAPAPGAVAHSLASR